MARAVSGTCSVTLGLLRGRCDRVAAADCVYCGRPFCAHHGKRGPDYTDTCSRKTCRAKGRDLQEHLEWRERVGESNRMSVCALEDCESRMRHQCSRCRLVFCEEHVKEFRVVVQSGAPNRSTRAVVCEHCRSRRKLWD